MLTVSSNSSSDRQTDEPIILGYRVAALLIILSCDESVEFLIGLNEEYDERSKNYHYYV